jgi:hypothetical protein
MEVVVSEVAVVAQAFEHKLRRGRSCSLGRNDTADHEDRNDACHDIVARRKPSRQAQAQERPQEDEDGSES